MSPDDKAADRKLAIKHLRQLIEALDRRVPHMTRAGENKIAADAADLKDRAIRRLKVLEESD